MARVREPLLAGVLSARPGWQTAIPALRRGRLPRASTPRRVGSTAVFIAGFTTVFAGLGLVAETIGRNADALVSSIQRVGGGVVIALGLVQLGVLRNLGSRTWRSNTRLPHGTITRPFVTGLTFGAAWTPCVGPLLGAALVTARSHRRGPRAPC